MNNKQPLVTIIIPCYNREKYITDAIDSCLRQTYKNIEIVVVDDGSSDQSVKVIKSYGPAVKLIKQPNQGVSSARNTGIHNANGDYLIFLDSDDWISDDLVEHHIQTFKRWPDIDIACANSRSVNSDGNMNNISKSNWPDTPSTPTNLFLLTPPPFPACEMYKARTVRDLGGHDPSMKAFSDAGLRIKIILNKGKVVRTQAGYAVYRPVENSLTKNRIKLHRYAMILIKKLKSEFPDNKFHQLLVERKKRHRQRYWNSIFSHHYHLNPVSIGKFLIHLAKISKVDPTYILFILKEKPWSKNQKDAF